MERRLELSLEEGFRWFVSNAWGYRLLMYILIQREWRENIHWKVIPPLYALPIPYDAIERNYRLEQNPR